MPYIGKAPDSLVTGQSTSEDIFTATANQTVFTLTADVTIETDIIVTINGVLQSGTAYSMSGTGNRTLTFSAPLTVGDELRVLHIGFKPTTTIFADETVTTAKLADNAVDGTKIADDAVNSDHYVDGSVDNVHLATGIDAGKLINALPQTLGVDSIIRTNAKTISTNITFAGTENGMTAGPITVANGYSVVVTNGSSWTIV